jgi:hypothetical protein
VPRSARTFDADRFGHLPASCVHGAGSPSCFKSRRRDPRTRHVTPAARHLCRGGAECVLRARSPGRAPTKRSECGRGPGRASLAWCSTRRPRQGTTPYLTHPNDTTPPSSAVACERVESDLGPLVLSGRPTSSTRSVPALGTQPHANHRGDALGELVSVHRRSAFASKRGLPRRRNFSRSSLPSSASRGRLVASTAARLESGQVGDEKFLARQGRRALHGDRKRASARSSVKCRLTRRRRPACCDDQR